MISLCRPDLCVVVAFIVYFAPFGGASPSVLVLLIILLPFRVETRALFLSPFPLSHTAHPHIPTQARQAAEKEARKNTRPEEMFLASTDLYSAFDDQGVPTTDKAGEPLSKNAIKKLKKEWDKQKKLYEKTQAEAAAAAGTTAA